MSDSTKIINLFSSKYKKPFKTNFKRGLVSTEELLGLGGFNIKNAPFFNIPMGKTVLMSKGYDDFENENDVDYKIVDQSVISSVKTLGLCDGIYCDLDKGIIYGVFIESPITYISLFLMLNDENYTNIHYSEQTKVQHLSRIFAYLERSGFDLGYELITTRKPYSYKKDEIIKVFEYGWGYGLYLYNNKKEAETQEQTLVKETFELVRDCKKQKTYIMKDKTTNLYKIGKSINPRLREKTLQSEKPTIEMVWQTDINVESELHERYRSQRVRGEWFNLTPIQVKYITKHY